MGRVISIATTTSNPRGQRRAENTILRRLVALFQKILKAIIAAFRRRPPTSILLSIAVVDPVRRAEADVAEILYQEKLAAFRYGRGRIARDEGDFREAQARDDSVAGEMLGQSRDSARRFVGRIEEEIARILDDFRLRPDSQEAIEEIRLAIGSVLDWQIKRLAVTESASAENLGAYRELQRRNIPAKKWETMRDEAVRDVPPHSHRVLQGEVVWLYDFFSNGLEFPGDFAHGTPADWENCRCWIVRAKASEVVRAS